MDVSVLALGLDWRARRAIQGELRGLAISSETSRKRGLVHLTRRVARLLLRAKPSWVYGGALNYSRRLSAREAEAAFRRATTDAASRYREEVLRNLRGQRSHQPASESRARSEEGPGLLVVTLAVAARRELPDVRDVRDAFCLSAALSSIAQLRWEELVAVEVIWSPAVEDDRMSSAELEILYPELRKIEDSSMVGRVFCRSCGGPYAAELRRCPYCASAL